MNLRIHDCGFSNVFIGVTGLVAFLNSFFSFSASAGKA